MTDSLLERELLRARWRRARGPLKLIDPTADDFATGGLAQRLDSDAFVRLLILPADPEATIVEFDEDTWNWWLADRTDPITGSATQWTRGQRHSPTSEAMVRFDWNGDQTRWSRCVALHRNGGLELGLASSAVREHEDTRFVLLIRIVGHLWWLLDLQRHVIGRLGESGPWETTLAMRGMQGAHLANVAEGWAQPGTPDGYGFSTSAVAAAITRREIEVWPDEEGVRTFAFALGGWIEDTWGRRERRFLADRGELEGEFDVRRFEWS